MLGMVFRSMAHMLEKKVSDDYAKEVFTTAGVGSPSSFEADKSYPFTDMQKVLSALEDNTGKSSEELLHDFGYYLFNRLVEVHGQVLSGRNSLLEVLEYLDTDIHSQVRELYPDADLPTVTVLSRTDNAMRLRYCSKYDLYALAEGFLDAAADHYSTAIERETIACSEPHTYQFSLTVVCR